MKTTFKIMLGLAVLAALSGCGDKAGVRTPWGRCERVSAGGPHGDFNVRCPGSSELAKLSMGVPNVRFLSDVGDSGSTLDSKTILVNVQPNELGPGRTCYHILADGMDVAHLPTPAAPASKSKHKKKTEPLPVKEIFYAILFCPDK